MTDDLDQGVAVAILKELKAATGLTLTGLAKQAKPKLAASTLTRFYKEPTKVAWQLSLPTIKALIKAHGMVPSARDLLRGIDLDRPAGAGGASVDSVDEIIDEDEKRKLLRMWGQLEKADRRFLMRAIQGSLIEAIEADKADDVATHGRSQA